MALYHSARGSVDYTIVGSPTITNGVASGFSNSNYLTVPTLRDTTFSSLEFQTRILNFSGVGYNNVLIRSGNAYFLVRYNTNGKVEFIYQSDDGSKTLVTTNDVSSIQDLYAKVILKNNLQELYTSTNGTTWQLEGSATDTITSLPNLFYNVETIGSNPGNNTQRLIGSIDLNNTYIKVNEQPWFGICPVEVKKHQIMGPVGYTVVGSPTIEDGVLTNITANDYLSIGTYSGETPTSIEIGSSFKTSDTTVLANSVIGRLTGADTGIFWGNSSFPDRICFKHRVSYDNGTTWTAVEIRSAALSLNTKYYVKFIISLAEQKLTGYVSTDNTNWTSYVANFNSGAILEGLTSIAIGKIFGHNASPLPIYLDYTYIKVNGKLWFWQPQETKRIVVNGVEVWTKPE